MVYVQWTTQRRRNYAGGCEQLVSEAFHQMPFFLAGGQVLNTPKARKAKTKSQNHLLFWIACCHIPILSWNLLFGLFPTSYENVFGDFSFLNSLKLSLLYEFLMAWLCESCFLFHFVFILFLLVFLYCLCLSLFPLVSLCYWWIFSIMFCFASALKLRHEWEPTHTLVCMRTRTHTHS